MTGAQDSGGFPDDIVMPPGSLYSARYPMALAYAATKHAAQRRKDDAGTPYIEHPVAVSALVWRYGSDSPDGADDGEDLEDLAIAALLHDVAEDAGGRAVLAEVRALFGDRVAQVVTAASDALPEPGEQKAPWRPRKEGHIARMNRLAVGDDDLGLAPDPGACLVIACDKLHNLTGTAESVSRVGDAYLDRFNGGRDGTRWYYRAVTEALGPALPDALLAELERHLSRLGA